MKKSTLAMALVIISTVVLFSQEKPVLLTIADEQVTLEEFERIYKKNNNETSLNRQTPEEYLELFINFKLKVKEAESLGMDTTAKFINELEGYRAQLAKPYLADNETKEEMLLEAYERSKTDLKASHILIKLPSYPTPEDTLAALEKIIGIRERVVKGEDFETVARATSDDSSVKSNGGNLNYFTVFSMIYPFENVAYTTPMNTISEPFRSDYGYHILKVTDSRPARGQFKAAIIFIRTPEGMAEADKKSAYEKTQMIYDSLLIGSDFGHMARSYSEDPNSARNNGETSWFGTGRMIPEIEEACNALENIGDLAKPVKSSYGWFIIKLLGKKGIGSYEEMKPELLEKINRGNRAKYSTDRYVAQLKKEYNFTLFTEAYNEVYLAADSTLINRTWKGDALKDNKTPLFRIGTHTATVGEFATYMEANQGKRLPRTPQLHVDLLFKDFSNEEIMKYDESLLPEKYPEFRYIYQEYHDGILLFDIMDQNVWSKAVSDTVGLTAFHKEHLDDYMWEERFDAYVVTFKEGVDADDIRKSSKKIVKGKLDQAALNEKYCSTDSAGCITVTRVLVEKGENGMVDALHGQTGPGQVVPGDGESILVILKGIRSPEPKKLNEARGQITSDYQNFLETEWISKLKQKYPVEVDKSLLSRIKS